MKAGIVEIPDVALVTKADLGGIAERAQARPGRSPRHRLRQRRLAAAGAAGFRQRRGQGIDATLEAIERHQAFLAPDRGARRAAQDEAWLERWVREEFGRRGALHLGPGPIGGVGSPFRRLARLGAAGHP